MLPLYWSEITLLGTHHRLDHVLELEPAAGLGEIGAGRAAVVAEAVADDAPRRRERALAVLRSLRPVASPFLGRRQKHLIDRPGLPGPPGFGSGGGT